jgi:chaperonin GroES
MSKIRPVGDRVVVTPAMKEEITKSGIVIPDTAKEKPQQGTSAPLPIFYRSLSS